MRQGVTEHREIGSMGAERGTGCADRGAGLMRREHGGAACCCDRRRDRSGRRAGSLDGRQKSASGPNDEKSAKGDEHCSP